MANESGLIVVENLVPAIFFDGGLDPILHKIRSQVLSVVPSVETATGRKEIASLAYKVAQSKTALDKMGKDLVSDWKEKAKKVDESRKKARDFLDALKSEVRQPLTEWEEAEKAKEEAARMAEDLRVAEEEAYNEHALWLRLKEVEAKEAAIRAEEEARRIQEEKERSERERAEREARIAKEAADAAKREAEAAAAKAKEESERREREAVLAKERAEREAILVRERAEREKAEAVKLAELQAEAEARRIEQERLAKEEAERKERERIAKNKEHRKRIMLEARNSLIDAGLEQKIAETVIKIIVAGKAKHISVGF